MMNERVAWHAISPSTLATPRPRPNRPPSFSIVTSRRKGVTGHHDPLEAPSSMPAKSPMRSPKPGCFATYTAIVWASASTCRTPGMTGSPGKCPPKNHSVAVTALRPTIRWASASYSTMPTTRRNGQRCGISAWISLLEWMVAGVACGDAGALGRRPGRRSWCRGASVMGGPGHVAPSGLSCPLNPAAAAVASYGDGVRTTAGLTTGRRPPRSPHLRRGRAGSS